MSDEVETNTSKSHATDDDTVEITAASVVRKSNIPKTQPSYNSEMNEWFENAGTKECEAMTAIQLDYRFEPDDFRTEWWGHAELLGFTRVDYYHYRLPPTFERFYFKSGSTMRAGKDPTENDMVHTAKTLCSKLNTLAIPQGRSVYDRIGDSKLYTPDDMFEVEVNNNRILNLNARKDDIVDQWTTIRDELIFRKFHIGITKECQKRAVDQNESTQNRRKSERTRLLKRNEASTKSKRKLWSSVDAGAELLFRRGKRGKGNLVGNNQIGANKSAMAQDLEMSPTNYVTLSKDYKECARTHELNDTATIREESIEPSFEEWKFLISTNHSLLIYGVGSKKNLLKNFAKHDIEGDVIEIDGFDNSLTVDGILQLLIDRWLDGREPTIRKKNLFHVHFEKNDRTNRITVAERVAPYFPYHGDFRIIQKAIAVAKRIARQVKRSSRPITLVIHNIDGVGLCNETAQEVLAVLVSQSRTDCGLNAIRLVASVDHINGQIYIESNSNHRLHFVRKEVHTHRPYVDEVLHEEVDLENHTSEKSKYSSDDRELENDLTGDNHLLIEHDSIFSVLKSLASTHAESLRQLAWLQLESEQDWVSYTDLLKKCRAVRIVQADQQLRLYLGELLDHNILEKDKHKSASSMVSYRIPYSNEILNLIWEFKPDR